MRRATGARPSLCAALFAAVFLEHRLDVLPRDVVVEAEAAPEALGDVHQLVDDGLHPVIVRQPVEPLGDELEDVDRPGPQGDLKDLAQAVAPGDDPAGR